MRFSILKNHFCLYHFKLVNVLIIFSTRTVPLGFHSPLPTHLCINSLENSSNPICAEPIFYEVSISLTSCQLTRWHTFKDNFLFHSQQLSIHNRSQATWWDFLLSSLFMLGCCLCISLAGCDKGCEVKCTNALILSEITASLELCIVSGS